VRFRRGGGHSPNNTQLATSNWQPLSAMEVAKSRVLTTRATPGGKLQIRLRHEEVVRSDATCCWRGARFTENCRNATSKTRQNHEIPEMLAPLTRLGAPHISARPWSLDHGAFTVAPFAGEPPTVLSASVPGSHTQRIARTGVFRRRHAPQDTFARPAAACHRGCRAGFKEQELL
jgi:hypothetical protein